MPGSALIVGGWFAVVVITTFVNKARSILEERHQLHGDIADMLFNVDTNLTHIQAVVDIAESMRITKRCLMIWLQKIKEIASEAEDLLDDFEANMIQQSLHNQVSLVDRLKHLFFDDRHGIEKLKALLARLDKIASKAVIFLDLLKSNDSDEGVRDFRLKIRPMFYGREEEKKQLMNIIFPDVPQSENFATARMQLEMRGTARVVCIVGETGVGKTTLAQVIYNHPNVKEAFDLRGWAFLSHKFNSRDIFKNVVCSFEAAHQHFDSEITLEPLQASSNCLENNLSSIIHNKRFLLVLDNAHDNLADVWNTLCSGLNGGATGSIILVTTRSEAIARRIEDNTHIKDHIALDTLQTDTISTILKHHALGTKRMKLDEGHWRKVAWLTFTSRGHREAAQNEVR